MTILQALILGIVQGITEMLPISSSAHLNIIPWILGWTNNPAFVNDFNNSFEVALHFGTLIAIVIYFLKEWINLIKAGFNTALKKEESADGKIFWYIVISTIFAGVLAIVLETISEKVIGDNIDLKFAIIAISLIIMGIILAIVDKKSDSTINFENINKKQAVLIGASQALAAAFPGVSRSGITITIARLFKIDRESAAKYSFLLSAPIIGAAVLVKIKDFALTSVPFWIGVITSFLVGIVVIKFLMQYLKKGSYKVFAIYRIIIGLLIFLIIFIR